MFEKKAEDSWRSKGLWYKVNADESSYKTGFKDGYVKANEWYYIKDGKLPKECENVLCYCKGPGIKFCCVGHTLIGGDNKVRWWANNKSEELIVIAWKEIVLPEIKEIE